MTAIERVGIVGAGRTSSAHVRALRRLNGATIAGVLDSDPERASALAERFALPHHFSDGEEFYREVAPDIVHILTPPHTHEGLALEALRHGAHVLIEKPPSLTVAGCDALQRAAEAAHLTIGLNENFAQDPAVMAARLAVERGSLGRLVHVDSFFGFDGRAIKGDLSDWPWARHLPGGILEDLLPHPLTVAQALCGHTLAPRQWEVVRSGRLGVDMGDELRLMLLGADGTTAHISLSLSAHPPGFTLRIHGTRATLELDLRNMLVDLNRVGPGSPAVLRGLRLTGRALRILMQTGRNAVGGLFRVPRPGDPVHLIRAHYAALQRGTELPAPLSRARTTLEIARTIWPSG